MCTWMLWDDKKAKVPVAGRVMDWLYDEYRPDLWILPRGGTRDGGPGPNPAQWEVTHGSLVVPVSWNVIREGEVIEVGTSTDGINEKGLAGHTLWMSKSEYPQPDGRPTLSIAKWLQYYLDRFATVDEAVDDFTAITERTGREPYCPLPVNIGTIEGKLHLTLEDSTGHSAVIEYVGGCRHEHGGREYSVITNSLTCDEQSQTEVKKYAIFAAGGNEPLPGSTSSRHRFVRAWYYREQLPEADSERETVAYVLSVLRNVSYPFGKVDPFLSQDEAAPSTRWRSVINLTPSDNVYYFESTSSPNIFWVEIPKLDFSKLQRLDLRSEPKRDFYGEVSQHFKDEQTPFEWAAPGDIPA